MRQSTKHVVILGAGSSVTSGYPLANELRLLISSGPYLRDKLDELGLEKGTPAFLVAGFSSAFA